MSQSNDVSKRLRRSASQSILMETAVPFDASIPTACSDHDDKCSSMGKAAIEISEDELNLLANVIERYNRREIGHQRFVDEICAVGNSLQEILKTFQCTQTKNNFVRETIPLLYDTSIENSERPIDQAVVFARDLLSRVPPIKDSRVLDENVFVMSFAATLQKLFHGIVPYVRNAYEIADMFRHSVNRITRPGFVLFRQDTAPRAGRALYPVVDRIDSTATTIHKILIFSTTDQAALNSPDPQEYQAAINALNSGRAELIAPYLSLDDIGVIYSSSSGSHRRVGNL